MRFETFECNRICVTIYIDFIAISSNGKFLSRLYYKCVRQYTILSSKLLILYLEIVDRSFESREFFIVLHSQFHSVYRLVNRKCWKTLSDFAIVFMPFKEVSCNNLFAKQHNKVCTQQWNFVHCQSLAGCRPTFVHWVFELLMYGGRA